MLDKHFFTVSDLRAEGERGLLGLTLDPAWPNPRNVYLYHTNDTTGKIQNWIYRLTAKNGMGTSPTKLVAFKASNATNHNGGVIHFGPDNMLYAVVGENANPANSQNTSTSNLGKVLRMTKSGGVPSGNPGFGAGRIWSYGLRNSFGFSWDPQNGNLWESENGPECNDEDNLIVMGGNYGWGPNETCSGSAPGNTNQDGPSPRLPEFFWPSPIAPTGVSFCNGCGLTGQEGHLIVGDCNNGDLHSFTLDAQRDDITGGDSILWNGPSCVFAVETGPGGVLYFSNGSGIYRLGN